ncbi:MAG TPA: phosphomannomutase/phosphoglucomutase, partial [Candidatus Limnocylindria bacterium]|nr:phosphomannomutase/phosphoglucomutase [Candidatus Limnocylindria bacterium]
PLVVSLSNHRNGDDLMLDTIFREYDIRGKVGSELVLDEVYDLGRAIAYYFVRENPTISTVALGMDGRVHSPAMQQAMCKALVDSGLHVILIGVCPSPVLYFTLFTHPEVDAGLMITASHNPKEYNGIKICLGKKTVWGVQVREIRQLFKERKRVIALRKGTVRDYNSNQAYIAWLAEHFADLKNMNFSIVIDCGNGAGAAIIPRLVSVMGWSNAHLLCATIDGTYPNHEADPVKEKNMLEVKRVLAQTDIALGFGLDGDADRMVPMTKSGYLVPGDRLLALFAQQVVQENPGAAVVVDIKSSSGLLELLEQWGAKTCISPAGHAIIKDQMSKCGALLGGELSCHFFFHDRYFGYDDGIYAMMRLLQMVHQSDKSLDEQLQIFPHKISSLELLIPCAEDKKAPIITALQNSFAQRSDVATITIDGVRAQMPYGWGLVRASNTQPMLTVRFESDTAQGLARVKQDFALMLSQHFDMAVMTQLLQM